MLLFIISQIKKVYSINIVYFGLGQGTDYVYEYDGKFIGIHNGDILQPTHTQKAEFCDRCHGYAAVDLDCFGCHLTPEPTKFIAGLGSATDQR